MKVGDRVRFVQTYRRGRDGEQFARGELGVVVEIWPGGVVWVRMNLDGLKYPINFAGKYLAAAT